jgi:hypothetical protein
MSTKQQLQSPEQQDPKVVEMAEKILKFVEGYQPTTFVEIVRHLGEEASGEYEFGFPNNPNIVLWSGVSMTFINAYELVKGNLMAEPTDALIYMMDGEVLDYPIAKHFNYRRKHWLPVSLSIRTLEDQKLVNKFVRNPKAPYVPEAEQMIAAQTQARATGSATTRWEGGMREV